MKLHHGAEDSLGDLFCVQMVKILKTNAADYSRLTRKAYICHEALCASVECKWNLCVYKLICMFGFSK